MRYSKQCHFGPSAHNPEASVRKSGPTTRMRTAILAAVALCLTLTMALPYPVHAIPYESYVYDFWWQSVPSPVPYVPQRVIQTQLLGAGAVRSPKDLCVSGDTIYLLDSGNGRILCLSLAGELKRVISGFERDGKTESFSGPSGIFVTATGHVYVADTNNARIIELDSQGNFVREIGAPKSDIDGLISEGYRYRPMSVGVDQYGNVYVVADETYDGLLRFSNDGVFRGFIGAPRVSPSIWDYFWYRVGTREQKQRMSLFLPVQYTDIDVDEKGFIYSTVPPKSWNEPGMVKRLNPSGTDVLRRLGAVQPIGDVQYPAAWSDAAIRGATYFVDIAYQGDGIYHALDNTRGRVFSYDENGRLLWVFGGVGDQHGLFRNPAAIDTVGDKILVLDSASATITIFEPTEYGKAVLLAKRLFSIGRYDESARAWREALKYNMNYDLAYIGIGTSLMMQERYREAMDSFWLGNERIMYSKALRFYRSEVVNQYFGVGASILLALLCIGYVIYRWRKRVAARLRVRVEAHPGQVNGAANGQGSSGSAGLHSAGLDPAVPSLGDLRSGKPSLLSALRYAVHVALHPFDGFWELKHGRRGSLPAALVLLVVVSLTFVFMRQYTGFVFNARKLSEVNIIVEAASIVVPFLLWCAVNWALTTLMEGKGTFGEIFIASAYALTPLVLVNVPLTIISNVLTLEEGAFYRLFMVLGVIWFAALLLLAMAITHEYSMAKTITTAVLTGVGIGIVIFVGMLVFDLIDQMIGFVTDIGAELTYRL